MSSNQLRLKNLFGKYIINTCTSSELEELSQLMATVSENEMVLLDTKELWNRKEDAFNPSQDVDWKDVYGRLLQRIEEKCACPASSMDVFRKRLRRLSIENEKSSDYMLDEMSGIICTIAMSNWFKENNCAIRQAGKVYV